MRTLLALVLLTFMPLIAYAGMDKVLIEYNIGGGKCKHVKIINARTNEVVEITTEKQLFSDVEPSDTILIKELKEVIANSNLTIKDKTLLKNYTANTDIRINDE